jgi:hypothetical protein
MFNLGPGMHAMVTGPSLGRMLVTELKSQLSHKFSVTFKPFIEHAHASQVARAPHVVKMLIIKYKISSTIVFSSLPSSTTETGFEV